MPGYMITDYGKWRPDQMAEFENHSLFFDCRFEKEVPGGYRWEEKMKTELIPKVNQFLAEWTEKHASKVEESVNGKELKLKPIQVKELKPGALKAGQYPSKQEMRECMLPCPLCLTPRNSNPSVFPGDECMLSFLTGNNTKSTLYCFFCQTMVRVKDVLKRPIFLSYNWGCCLSTQTIAQPLCNRIFLLTEMPTWLDFDGGMGFGVKLVTEMREGVAGCDIDVLTISNAFCNSGHCLREFIQTATHHKFIIPLLVPDHGATRTGPSEWKGKHSLGDNDWWKQAEKICTGKDPDAPDKDIPWSYLSSFSPIDLREEILKKDGSLEDKSVSESRIIEQILDRFSWDHDV